MIASHLMISPIGGIKITCSENALISMVFQDNEHNQANDEMGDFMKDIMNQLEAYFNSKLQIFDIPLQPQGTDFDNRAWDIVIQIPFGRTRSYGDIAEELQIKNGARAVGLSNGRNPIPIIVPCHRVLGKNGELTGYAGGIWRKKWLLEHEGMGRQVEIFK